MNYKTSMKLSYSLFFLLIGIIIPQNLSAIVIDGIGYRFIEGPPSHAVVVSYNQIQGNCVIPEKIFYQGKEWSVDYIDDYAFKECENLQSVIIPNSVMAIGKMAFESCTNLKSITIPNSVFRIEDYCFMGCKRLESVSIGNKVTTIGNGAFQSCSELSNIIIPNSVTSIGDFAFCSCI